MITALIGHPGAEKPRSSSAWKMMALTVPPTLLAIADEVIE
jgi:hypothetical protein